MRAWPLLLALACLPALADRPARAEGGGTGCGLYALVDPDDAGVLLTYDGLRKGLELAQLPRICRHDPDPRTGGVVGFLERQAAEASALRAAGLRPEPLCAVGDRSCAAVVAAGTRLPFVMAVERYSADRRPLVPLPVPVAGAVCYADVPAEHVGTVLRSFLGKDVRTLRPEAPGTDAGAEALAAFARAAGIRMDPLPLPAAGAPATAAPPGLAALLHLRITPARPLAPFTAALAAARRWHVPLITDDRARFGHGAVVLLVARHETLGRVAADQARRLREDPSYAPAPRAVSGLEVWIDLQAADEQGVDLPLSFIARADKLKPSRRLPTHAGSR